MSKEEIALELVKLTYVKYFQSKAAPYKTIDAGEEITNLYNCIYENLKLSEPSKQQPFVPKVLQAQWAHTLLTALQVVVTACGAVLFLPNLTRKQ